jgi:RNA 3'-terminal phosphate cyclase (ATP)
VLEIDGSYGEGGGQILRTSLALSILTRRPFRITRIRANRRPAGLKPQHLLSVQAAARISHAALEGDAPGSTALAFHPGKIHPGEYTFDVMTAGSTGLIFQTLHFPLGFSSGSSRLVLKGGTHVAWSPSADYLREVFLPAVGPMGVGVSLEVERHGFYPKGGGVLNARVESIRAPLSPLRIEGRGRLLEVKVVSIAANLPPSIPQRQLDRALDLLRRGGFPAEGTSKVVPSQGPGTSCFILARYEGVNAGFSALGEIGKRAERVAEEAVDGFLKYSGGGGALDSHLGDQAALPAALAGGESVLSLSEMTGHVRTNIRVIEQFLPVRFDLEEFPDGTGGILRVRGCAYAGDSS